MTLDWDDFEVRCDDEGQWSYVITDPTGVTHWLDTDDAARLMDALTGHAAPNALSRRWDG